MSLVSPAADAVAPQSAPLPSPGTMENQMRLVERYAQRCKEEGADLVLEFVSILADPGITSCTLTNRLLQIRDRDVKCICEILEENMSVEALYLDGNRITSDGATYIATMLLRNRGISVLGLGNNAVMDHGSVAIASSLRMNSTLTALDISHNQLGTVGVHALAEVLRSSHTLRELALCHNPLDSVAVTDLADAVKGNSTLRHLHLTYNRINDDGAVVIADSIAQHRSLYSLDLSANSIGTIGGKALGSALESNTTLVRLNLRGNAVRAEGYMALAAAVGTNCTLQVLLVGHNHAPDTAVAGLIDALSTNCFMVAVDLLGCRLTGHTAKHLSHFITTSPKLRVLFANIPPELASTVEQAVQERARKSLPALSISSDFSADAVTAHIPPALAPSFGSITSILPLHSSTDASSLALEESSVDGHQALLMTPAPAIEGGKPSMLSSVTGFMAGTPKQTPLTVTMAPTPSSLLDTPGGFVSDFGSLVPSNPGKGFTASELNLISQMERKMDLERLHYHKHIRELEMKLEALRSSMSSASACPSPMLGGELVPLPASGDRILTEVGSEGGQVQTRCHTDVNEFGETTTTRQTIINNSDATTTITTTTTKRKLDGSRTPNRVPSPLLALPYPGASAGPQLQRPTVTFSTTPSMQPSPSPGIPIDTRSNATISPKPVRWEPINSTSSSSSSSSINTMPPSRPAPPPPTIPQSQPAYGTRVYQPSGPDQASRLNPFAGPSTSSSFPAHTTRGSSGPSASTSSPFQNPFYRSYRQFPPGGPVGPTEPSPSKATMPFPNVFGVRNPAASGPGGAPDQAGQSPARNNFFPESRRTVGVTTGPDGTRRMTVSAYGVGGSGYTPSMGGPGNRPPVLNQAPRAPSYPNVVVPPPAPSSMASAGPGGRGGAQYGVGPMDRSSDSAFSGARQGQPGAPQMSQQVLRSVVYGPVSPSMMARMGADGSIPANAYGTPRQSGGAGGPIIPNPFGEPDMDGRSQRNLSMNTRMVAEDVMSRMPPPEVLDQLMQLNSSQGSVGGNMEPFRVVLDPENDRRRVVMTPTASPLRSRSPNSSATPTPIHGPAPYLSQYGGPSQPSQQRGRAPPGGGGMMGSPPLSHTVPSSSLTYLSAVGGPRRAKSQDAPRTSRLTDEMSDGLVENPPQTALDHVPSSHEAPTPQLPNLAAGIGSQAGSRPSTPPSASDRPPRKRMSQSHSAESLPTTGSEPEAPPSEN